MSPADAITDGLARGMDVISTRFDEGTVFLPQIMSRKKQVIPMLSALWG